MRRRALGIALALAAVHSVSAQVPERESTSAGTSPRMVRVSRAWPVMGTMFVATVWTTDSAHAPAALGAAHDAVRLVDSLMSTYRPESEISAVNAAAGRAEPVRVSSHTMTVLRKARLYWQLSGGAFDPTVGPIVRAWGFERNGGHRPSRSALDSLRALVEFGAVSLDSVHGTVRLPRAGMRLDLGGIAKGYALDLARRALADPSIRGGTVDLGGNLLMFGRPPSGGYWRVAIVNPRHAEAAIAELALDSGAVATSGDYEHFVIIDGRRYGHLIDPRTARPSSGILSATAVGPLGEWSDGLSATLFLLGRERGRALVDSVPGIGGLWVVDRGQRAIAARDVVCSRRMREIVVLSPALRGRADRSCVVGKAGGR